MIRRWNVPVLAALLLLGGVVMADSLEVLPESPQPSADAPPAAAVAAELLKIQTQLGGSIVQGAPLLNDPLLHETPPPNRTSGSTGSPLREAAWQLDLTARRLELADRIEQADAVRDLSRRLRRDARTLKSGNPPPLATE